MSHSADPVLPGPALPAGAPIVELEGAWPRVIVRPARYARGYSSNLHRHRLGQVLYATKGLMTAETPGGTWLVPAGRAVWIPAMQEHSAELLADTEMCSIYIDPAYTQGLPASCKVITVTPLLRELALFAAQEACKRNEAVERAVGSLVSHLVADAVGNPLEMPVPASPQLRRIYDALLADPSDERTIDDWAAIAGMGGRTLIRRLQRETGMTFRVWRQQIRLLASLGMIAQGKPITSVAFDAGYSTPSAYCAAFRKCFGVSPSAYFS